MALPDPLDSTRCCDLFRIFLRDVFRPRKRKPPTRLAFMKYRAKNSFGGYMVGTASATYRNDNCKHTIVSIE